MRNLGNTDIKIKRIGFGGLPIQRINQDETNDVINEIEKYGIILLIVLEDTQLVKRQ